MKALAVALLLALAVETSGCAAAIHRAPDGGWDAAFAYGGGRAVRDHAVLETTQISSTGASIVVQLIAAAGAAFALYLAH